MHETSDPFPAVSWYKAHDLVLCWATTYDWFPKLCTKGIPWYLSDIWRFVPRFDGSFVRPEGPVVALMSIPGHVPTVSLWTTSPADHLSLHSNISACTLFSVNKRAYSIDQTIY